MDKYFLTFADKRWIESSKRFNNDLQIIQQNFNYFKDYFIWNEDNCTKEYKNIFSKYFNDHGFGWWSWKPHIILEILKKIKEDDVLLFLDGGCSFPISKIDNFIKDLDLYINNLKFFDIALTSNRTQCQDITLYSVLKNLNLLNNKYFCTLYQNWQSGLILFKKNEKTMKLVQSWYQYYLDHIEDFHNYKVSYEKQLRPYFQKLCADQAILHSYTFKYNFNIMNITNLMYGYKVVTRIRK